MTSLAICQKRSMIDESPARLACDEAVEAVTRWLVRDKTKGQANMRKHEASNEMAAALSGLVEALRMLEVGDDVIDGRMVA